MGPTYYGVCMARKYVNFALSGNGRDEIFAGYDRYGVHLRRKKFELIPQWVWRLYRERIYSRLPHNLRGKKFSYNVSLPWRERYVDGISFVPSFERDMPLWSSEFRDTLKGSAKPEDVIHGYFCRVRSYDPVSHTLYADTNTSIGADILSEVSC